MTLNNLAVLQSAKNEFDKAEQSYSESLDIYRKFAAENPETYLPDVGMTLINLAIFYLNYKQDKEASLNYLQEAIEVLWPFKEIPYIQNYLDSGYKLLHALGIQPKNYLKVHFNNKFE